MAAVNRIVRVALLVVAIAARADALELHRATVDAWQKYLSDAGACMQARLDGTKHFLWIDESPDRTSRANGGEIVVAPVLVRGGQNVLDGLIHHWIGAAYIPGATIENLLAIVHDYSGTVRSISPS